MEMFSANLEVRPKGENFELRRERPQGLEEFSLFMLVTLSSR